MPPKTLHLVGAGGHAKVVLATVRLLGGHEQVRIFDSDPAKHGLSFGGLVIEAYAPATLRGLDVHVCVGGNATRARLAAELCAHGAILASIVHPTAIVYATAQLADGVLVAAGAVIGPDAVIGRGCIVNHAAVVDHDCVVGDFVHVAPCASLGGEVAVGEHALIGAGARILPGLALGAAATIGAGAVVLANVESHRVVVGVPGKLVR